jgi:hypothetical protein
MGDTFVVAGVLWPRHLRSAEFGWTKIALDIAAYAYNLDPINLDGVTASATISAPMDKKSFLTPQIVD